MVDPKYFGNRGLHFFKRVFSQLKTRNKFFDQRCQEYFMLKIHLCLEMKPCKSVIRFNKKPNQNRLIFFVIFSHL